MVLLVAGSVLSGSSPSPAGTAVDPEVLRLREAAWRAWFAGDDAALRQMLPPEFIGISWNDGPFSSREATLEQSRAFRAAGGRLVDLEFPETRAQTYGDVMVLYGRFRAVLATEGGEQTVAGRLTEVFVRRDGRWLHPAWHLDNTAKP
jgi:hypothetical protein